MAINRPGPRARWGAPTAEGRALLGNRFLAARSPTQAERNKRDENEEWESASAGFDVLGMEEEDVAESQSQRGAPDPMIERRQSRADSELSASSNRMKQQRASVQPPSTITADEEDIEAEEEIQAVTVELAEAVHRDSLLESGSFWVATGVAIVAFLILLWVGLPAPVNESQIVRTRSRLVNRGTNYLQSAVKHIDGYRANWAVCSLDSEPGQPSNPDDCKLDLRARLVKESGDWRHFTESSIENWIELRETFVYEKVAWMATASSIARQMRTELVAIGPATMIEVWESTETCYKRHHDASIAAFKEVSRRGHDATQPKEQRKKDLQYGFGLADCQGVWRVCDEFLRQVKKEIRSHDRVYEELMHKLDQLAEPTANMHVLEAATLSEQVFCLLFFDSTPKGDCVKGWQSLQGTRWESGNGKV